MQRGLTSSPTVHHDQVHCFVKRPVLDSQDLPTTHTCLHIYQHVCEQQIKCQVEWCSLMTEATQWVHYVLPRCYSGSVIVNNVNTTMTVCSPATFVSNWCGLDSWLQARWGMYTHCGDLWSQPIIDGKVSQTFSFPFLLPLTHKSGDKSGGEISQRRSSLISSALLTDKHHYG